MNIETSSRENRLSGCSKVVSGIFISVTINLPLYSQNVRNQDNESGSKIYIVTFSRPKEKFFKNTSTENVRFLYVPF